MNRFDDDLLTRIIGPGVTGIFCQPMQVWDHHGCRSSYDHKREHFAKHGGVRFADAAPVPVWDFVIHRGDGERVRLHPSQMHKKVSISMMGAPIPTAADGPPIFCLTSDSDGRTHLLPSSADTRGDRAAPPW